MEGHKQTWFVLNRLETDVNGEAEKLKAEKIMKDNYKSYREKVGRSGDDHKQLQLFFTNVSKSQNADKFIQERKLIYSIEL